MVTIKVQIVRNIYHKMMILSKRYIFLFCTTTLSSCLLNYPFIIPKKMGSSERSSSGPFSLNLPLGTLSPSMGAPAVPQILASHPTYLSSFPENCNGARKSNRQTPVAWSSHKCTDRATHRRWRLKIDGAVVRREATQLPETGQLEGHFAIVASRWLAALV